MATITIDIFDPKSIEKAANKINLLAVAANHVKELSVKAIADLGLQAAREGFDSANSVPWYGDHPVVVSLQETEKGYCICAVGEQVSFIEFGAGVYSNAVPYQGVTPEWVVPWGEYGKRKGRQHSWSYEDYINGKLVGRTTEGIMARQGMYFALQDMKNVAPSALKRYFEQYLR